jgi:hypothetical protein
LFFSAGEACLFLGPLVGVASESLGEELDVDFWVKKLEMLGCFRFRDGEGAEDCDD